MKKIMFNDKFGLTQAVLESRKTMTRRILAPQPSWVSGDGCIYNDSKLPAYKIGEVVAVAQCYNEVRNGGYPVDSRYDAFRKADWGDGENGVLKGTAGEMNKMFVKAEYMPHHIRITDLKVERLQDITEEDAMCEGIFKYDQPPFDMYSPWPPHVKPYKFDHDNYRYFCNARAAFAYLIDKVSGRGTWKSNPYVFVYSFKLIQ